MPPRRIVISIHRPRRYHSRPSWAHHGYPGCHVHHCTIVVIHPSHGCHIITCTLGATFTIAPLLSYTHHMGAISSHGCHVSWVPRSWVPRSPLHHCCTHGCPVHHCMGATFTIAPLLHGCHVHHCTIMGATLRNPIHVSIQCVRMARRSAFRHCPMVLFVQANSGL
jgi:hypothetical protein